MEAFGADGAFNDLEPQLLTRRGAAGDVALVAGIGEQALEPRKAPSNPGTDQAQAVTILDIGRASRPACPRAAMSRVAWMADRMPSSHSRRKWP